MRFLGIALAAVVCAVLALAQAYATVLVRARAQPGAWVTFVPAQVADAVDRADPGFPLPGVVRLVLARSALDAGDPDRAARRIAALPPSRDRSALEGRLAELRGDDAAAARAYLSAGDLDGVERRVDALLREEHVPEALALQRAVVARLQLDPTQRDALAVAFWRLGQVEQSQAYAYAVADPRRRRSEERSMAAYAHAVALAPVSIGFLIAAANQALNLDDLASAAAYFTRARNADPRSAAALAGMGDVALRTGDRTEAARWLARARAAEPNDPAVARLARALAL